jgi:DNA-directed RNA polymerase subunit K/omega
MQELQERQVHPELLEQLEQLVLPALQELQERQVPPELLEQQEQLEQLAQLALSD